MTMRPRYLRVHFAIVCLLLHLLAPATAAETPTRAAHRAAPVVAPRDVRVGLDKVVNANVTTAIQSARLVAEGPRLLELDLAYSYGGERGHQVNVVVDVLASNARLPIQHSAVTIQRGAGTVRVTLWLAEGAARVRISDGVRIVLQAPNGDALTSAHFALAKTWVQGDAALPGMLVGGPTPQCDVPQATDDGSSEAPSDRIVGRNITPDGFVELTYADGHRKRFEPGGYTLTFPDGRQQRAQMMDVQPPTPPLPPPGSSLDTWLAAEANRLLEVLKLLVGNDQAQINAYRAREGNGRSAFAYISGRSQAIAYLVQR